MKVSSRIKTDRVRPIMKGWSIKLLSTVIFACMASSAGHTSDLEIYQAPEGGNVVITMMLDNSISMGHGEVFSSIDSIKDDYSISPPRRGSNIEYGDIEQPLFDDQGVNTGEKITYRVYYRTRNRQPYYDRMSRLKMALIPMFANPKSNQGFGADIDINKYKIGMGSFEAGGGTSSKGRGKIDVQAQSLDLAHRTNLINKIKSYTANSYTPIANSYATAGAYMLGKGTTTTPIIPGQCNAQGIYFLTDGEPNQSQTTDTLNLMNNSLGKTPAAMGNSCNSVLNSSGTEYGVYSGWECIGEYAPLLNSNENFQEAAIKTATVGFGSVYETLSQTPKITKNVQLDNGIVREMPVYNCDGVTNTDAKNLCKLGEKGYKFGEGGFYFTKESSDISDSVKLFAKSLGANVIQPTSTGTMSVPLDSLGGLESRQFAYVPILEPTPKSSQLWNGNLKKYNVKNSTLLGGDNNFVFSDNSGLFATNTYDLWNTVAASRPDRGLPQVGGAYQKVFENTVATASGSRNLFVNNGSSLVNLKVTADKKPVNFNTLTTANGYSNPKKIALLNFMGYGESTSTTVTDGTAITASLNTDLKNVGGVLHSIPQLITKKVAVDATGKFDTSQREDYVIYGSMDGALHMLDDSTGKEVFTFVPKQILDLQPKALAGNGTAEDGSYPYGVDAPWLTYASYTTKSNTTGTGDAATTTNTFEAEQSFALGGLRMGGSMYYALDVSTPSTPKMIYSVGSNYANKLQDRPGSTPTVLAGTTSSTTSNAAEQQAFAKMGQSWGKPALGYVKSGGKRVMVSFLPGGYDTCYEDSKFKLGLTVTTNTVAGCNSKITAQGNGVYMVQMGEVETKTNNEEKVNVSTNNGKLLWWANNGGTSVTAASTATSASLQYSKADDLKHSVVTQIRTLDRNYDGLTDHIYFADLGGQVWRADINNNTDTSNFKVDRVVKVLDVSDQVGTGDAPPRIYERPLITFYNGKFGYIDAANQSGTASGVQAMVTVGTGDRSNPVTATRNVPNALYSIIDKDVSRSDLFFYGTGTAPTISLRTPVNRVGVSTDANNKLQKLTFSAADISAAAIPGGAAARAGIKENMQSGAVQGWYMPFDTWLNDVKQTTGPYKMKMFNEPDALAGILVSSSYNPDKGQAIQACSAGVKGATQRERTCLPYGTCLDGSGNGILTSRATFNAGSGIVDNIVTQFNDTSIFSGLVNRCEGAACTPKVICPSGDCKPVPPTCTGPTCSPLDGFNTDKRINPLSWIEH